MTITELRQAARELGLDDGGTEAELTDRINAAVGGKTTAGSGKRPPRASRTPRQSKQQDIRSDDDAPERPATSGDGKRTPGDRKLMAALAGTYLSAGMALQGIGVFQMMRAGTDRPGAIMRVGLELHNPETVDACVNAWMDVCDQNPKIKKALVKAMEGTAIATLVGVHLAIGIRAGLAPGIGQTAFAGQPGQNGA